MTRLVGVNFVLAEGARNIQAPGMTTIRRASIIGANAVVSAGVVLGERVLIGDLASIRAVKESDRRRPLDQFGLRDETGFGK